MIRRFSRMTLKMERRSHEVLNWKDYLSDTSPITLLVDEVLASPLVFWCETHNDLKEAPSYMGCRRGLAHTWPAGSPSCVYTQRVMVEVSD